MEAAFQQLVEEIGKIRNDLNEVKAAQVQVAKQQEEQMEEWVEYDEEEESEDPAISWEKCL
jgi:hypothetical protein